MHKSNEEKSWKFKQVGSNVFSLPKKHVAAPVNVLLAETPYILELEWNCDFHQELCRCKLQGHRKFWKSEGSTSNVVGIIPPVGIGLDDLPKSEAGRSSPPPLGS